MDETKIKTQMFFKQNRELCIMKTTNNITSRKQFLGVFFNLKAQVPSPIVSLVYQVVTMETNEELEGRFQEKDESQRKRFQEKKN